MSPKTMFAFAAVSTAIVLSAGSASAAAFVLGGGTIEVQWKRLSASDWQVGPSMPGDSINTYLQPMPDNTAILVRVRAVNTAGRTSEWTAVTHQVVGKTAPPADVAGLAVAVVVSANMALPLVSALLWSLLMLTLVGTSLVGRALFYVLVVPTTMPGAFFWKNKGFEQHARDIGLAAMPQVGVVMPRH